MKADIKELARYFRDQVVKDFQQDPNHRFQVVDEPERHRQPTLRLDLALIQIDPSEPVLHALSWAGPPGTGTAAGAINQRRAAFEARLRDMQTDEVVATFADRDMQDVGPLDLTRLTWYGPVKGIMDRWAHEFVQVANRKPGRDGDGPGTFYAPSLLAPGLRSGRIRWTARAEPMVLAPIATLKERAAAALAEFLRLESAGGVLLLGMAMLGLAAANSPLATLYGRLLSLPFTVKLGSLGVDKPLLLVDQRRPDGAVLPAGRAGAQARDPQGQFSERAQIVAARACAAGGMVVPMLIYAALQPRQRRGHGRLGDPDRHRHRVRARHPGAFG